MTRISNADHVLLLLREQLQKIGQSRKARTSRRGPVRGATPRPIARLRAMDSLEAVNVEIEQLIHTAWGR